MAIQLSTAVRNDRLDAIETRVGTAPILEIWTGNQPADCATAASGSLLVQFALPSDWMAAASGGSKAKNGTWSGTAVGTGTAGYFRIVESGSPTTCHLQGDITDDMTIDNTSIAAGQTVTITGFTLTDANA